VELVGADGCGAELAEEDAPMAAARAMATTSGVSGNPGNKVLTAAMAAASFS